MIVPLLIVMFLAGYGTGVATTQNTEVETVYER